MAITDAPRVSIGGVQLATRWSITERIALGGMAITWGRTSHYDRAKPAQLKIEVLDTDGHLAGAEHLTGKPIVVTRADGRIIYRGRVDDYDFDYIHVFTPWNQERRRVWRLMISSACKLAELAQAVLPGTGDEPSGVKMLGPNYWFATWPAERLKDVMTAGASKIVAGIDWTDPYPQDEHGPPVRHWASGDGKSALDLIEGVYNAAPLAYVNYVPASNRVTLGQPAHTDGLELDWTGSKLVLDLPDGLVIPADDVAVPNGYRATTGLEEAIDIVHVVSPMPNNETIGTAETLTEHATERFDPDATGRRTHRVSNDVFYTIFIQQDNPNEPEEPGDSSEWSWPFSFEYVGDRWGPRDLPENPFHRGIDFVYSGIAGAAVPAAAAGTVVASEYSDSWGHYVLIDHGPAPDGGPNLKTRYAHLNAPGLPVGTVVTHRQTVGNVGNTGLSFGAHLHFETLVNDERIDPEVFMGQYGTGGGGGTTDPPPVDPTAGRWQIPLAADTAAMLDQINGKVNLPRLRLDWRNFDYAPVVAQSFIDTYAKPIPLYFPGSVFNVVVDAATTHQIIGGTLVYHKGWTHDFTVAPALGTAEGITVNQLVTIDPPTLADFDDAITIADLGNVSQGANA